jgi:hypothetical protein
VRLTALALLAASLALPTACTHVTVASPYGHEIRLLPRDEATQVRRQYRAWFAFWGLVRLSGKDPADVIRDEGLCAARVRVEDNVPDAIIAVMYTFAEPIGLIPQTIIIEGKRANGARGCE